MLGLLVSLLVRNPVLALPAIQALQDEPVEIRERLWQLLQDLRIQAWAKGDESLRRNKYMMFAYWRIVAVYAGHIARAIRRGGN